MTAGETKTFQCKADGQPTFQCKADGQPLPEVTWYKDDKKILNDSTTVVLGRNSHRYVLQWYLVEIVIGTYYSGTCLCSKYVQRW